MLEKVDLSSKMVMFAKRVEIISYMMVKSMEKNCAGLVQYTFYLTYFPDTLFNKMILVLINTEDDLFNLLKGTSSALGKQTHQSGHNLHK